MLGITPHLPGGGQGGVKMSSSRWVRITAVLAAGVFLAALIAPGVACALVGEPIPGAEVILQQQPGDDPIAYDSTGVGDHSIGTTCNISWAAGTFAGSGVMTATLGYSPVGITAPDGAVIKTAVWIRYSGPALLKDVRLALSSPAGSTNPHVYWLNPGTGRFEQLISSKNGGKVTTEVQHFSVYGVGGDPAPTSTPASSDWSLMALALAGLAVGGIALRSRRARPASSN